MRFLTAAELVMPIIEASRAGTLEQALKDIEKADVVIVDELGYAPLDIKGAKLLFQVMNGCYGKRSMVVATNIEFSKRGTVFADDKLASARSTASCTMAGRWSSTARASAWTRRSCWGNHRKSGRRRGDAGSVEILMQIMSTGY